MTTRDNSRSQRVRRYYELVDLGDYAGLVDLFAPGAIYRRPGFDPIVGRDMLAQFYLNQRQIKAGTHQIVTLVEDGSEVAVHGVFTGVLKDDTTVTLRFADFFELAADGRFERRDTFFYTPLV